MRLRTILCILALAVPSFAQAASHGILVTWTQTTDPNVTANSVYRAVSGGSYTSIFKSTTPITALLDTTGIVGTVYCYKSTAWVGSTESAQSDPTPVCLPFPPSPPTNVNASKQ